MASLALSPATALLSRFEATWRGDHKHEHGLLLDSDGNIITQNTGDYDSVHFDERDLEAARGGYVTHSHPRDLPPSGADLALAARYSITLRAVGNAPDTGQQFDYTVRIHDPQLADRIGTAFDDEVERAERELSRRPYGDLQWQRESRHLALQRLSHTYGFIYLRTQRNASLSETATHERVRLDTLAQVKPTLAHDVFVPLAADIQRLLIRSSRGGIVPLSHLAQVRSRLTALVQKTMLGTATHDGALEPYLVRRGQVIPRSVYFTTLYGLTRQAAALAVEHHAAIMRKYLPVDLIRAFSYATILPSDLSEEDSPQYDPLHLWLGDDGKRLSDRIWNATGDMRRKLDEYLTQAIARQLPVEQMASELEVFLVDGNGAYEALRLARTEVAAAHSRAGYLAALHNPFVEKYQPFTSPQHSCSDECDIEEANGPYDLDDPSHLPPFHPNCVLEGTTVVVPGTLIAAAKAFYVGMCIKITTRSGLILSVTPNHPILTSHGWIKAQFLNKSEQVVIATDVKRIALGVNPNNDYMPALIEDVFSSLEKSSGMFATTMPSSSEDFHGDAMFFDSDVNIVDANCSLLCDSKTLRLKPAGECRFDISNTKFLGLDSDSSLQLLTNGVALSTPSDLSLLGQSESFFDTRFGVSSGLTFTNTSNVNVISGQEVPNSISADAVITGEFLDRFASFITFDDVISIERFPFSGHVYDLQSDPYHLYISNGIITHNCQCSVRWSLVEKPQSVIAGLRRQIENAVASARTAITDILNPLSRNFINWLFRGH